MKLVVAIVMVWGLLLSAEAAFAAGSRLTVAPSEFDFGEIWQGVKVTHVFQIHNDGDKPLTIDGVRTSCGCTAAMLSSRRLPADGDAQLRVVFDSRHFAGPVVKTIFLASGDARHRVVELSLRGIVRPQVQFDPPYLKIGTLRPGTPTEIHVRVTNVGDRELLFTYLQRSLQAVAVKLSRRRLPVGASAELTVTIRPRKGEHHLDGYVFLRAQGLRIPEVKLPLHAVVIPESEAP